MWMRHLVALFAGSQVVGEQSVYCCVSQDNQDSLAGLSKMDSSAAFCKMTHATSDHLVSITARRHSHICVYCVLSFISHTRVCPSCTMNTELQWHWIFSIDECFLDLASHWIWYEALYLMYEYKTVGTAWMCMIASTLVNVCVKRVHRGLVLTCISN